MKNLSLIKLLILITISISTSCKKESSESPIVNPELKVNSVLEEIKALGYTDAEIIDAGDHYMVDGDIRFNKNENTIAKVDLVPQKLSQWGTANSIGYNNTNVVIQIHSSMTSWATDIATAIADYNAIPNLRLNFSIYDGSIPANVLLQEFSSSTYAGAAEFPRNGQVGSNIYIEKSDMDSFASEIKVELLIHEIGHALGLRHTDWYASSPPESRAGTSTYGGSKYHALQILGTPYGSDVNSVMNTNAGGSTLSAYDIIALEFMYPLNPPVSGSVPVFRYLGNDDHFYTTKLFDNW